MTFLATAGAYLYSQVSLWTGRANNAWGSSRVWNQGSSFETDLGNMTTDRNNWQANANYVYGASRVYGSGESWEAAYNRVLPPASPLVWDGTFVAGSCPASASVVPSVGGSGALPIAGSGSQTLTIQKTGRYMIYALCATADNQWGNNSSWRLDIITSAGTTTGNAAHSISGPYGGGNQGSGPQGAATANAVWIGTLSAGQTIQFRVYQQGGGYTATYATGGNQIHIEFVPTPSYPH